MFKKATTTINKGLAAIFLSIFTSPSFAAWSDHKHDAGSYRNQQRSIWATHANFLDLRGDWHSSIWCDVLLDVCIYQKEESQCLNLS